MSKYYSNRLHEYKIKQEIHKKHVDELSKMVKKRNILFNEVKSLDNNDGTVESYEYNTQMINIKFYRLYTTSKMCATELV